MMFAIIPGDVTIWPALCSLDGELDDPQFNHPSMFFQSFPESLAQFFSFCFFHCCLSFLSFLVTIFLSFLYFLKFVSFLFSDNSAWALFLSLIKH